jgi:hypothetical protein
MIRDTMPGLNGILVSADTTNFAGYSIDIDYRTDSLGTKPTTRAQRDVSGATVSMIYGNSIFSGEESLHTGLKTDADFYAKVGTTTLKLQTGESVTLKTMAPVPEPSTIALLTLGVCSVWFMRRR